MSRAVIQGYNLLCLLELNRIEGSLMLKVNFPAVSKIYLQSVNSDRCAKIYKRIGETIVIA